MDDFLRNTGLARSSELLSEVEDPESESLADSEEYSLEDMN